MIMTRRVFYPTPALAGKKLWMFIASPLMPVMPDVHGIADIALLNVGIAIYTKMANKPDHKRSLMLPHVS